MITYLKFLEGEIREILDFECGKIDVSKLSPSDGEIFRQTLLTLIRMPHFPAQRDYTYVAIVDAEGSILYSVSIYYVRKDLIERIEGEKNIGKLMSYFNGGLLKPEKIAKFIEDQIRRTWIDLAETAIKELSYQL
jgi:hypothetical protein